MNYVSEFLKRFPPYINEETLAQAASKDPNFLMDFISNGKINRLTKSLALIALGEQANKLHFEFIKKYTDDEDPFVREGSYKALCYYYFSEEARDHEFHSDLASFFKENLATETSEGVKKEIISSVRAIELFTEYLTLRKPKKIKSQRSKPKKRVR